MLRVRLPEHQVVQYIWLMVGTVGRLTISIGTARQQDKHQLLVIIQAI